MPLKNHIVMVSQIVADRDNNDSMINLDTMLKYGVYTQMSRSIHVDFVSAAQGISASTLIINCYVRANMKI